jgi:stage II sporulation protein D
VTARQAGRWIAVAILLHAVGACFSRVRTPEESPPPREQAPAPAPLPPVPLSDSIPMSPAPPPPDPGPGILVRIALRVARDTATLSATGAWRVVDEESGVLVRARAREHWFIERAGTRLRAVRSDGAATAWRSHSITQYADDAGLLTLGAKSYRGAMTFVATDTGVLIVNLLPMEDYLRGVVPIEIGERGGSERAAVEAQAVAARSYTVTRVRSARQGLGRSTDFDLVASVGDQVYGGRDAERPLADLAVRNTSGLVLTYLGRVVTAPFSSTCGGESAAAEEVWRSDGESHLRRVSDRIGTSDRYYCDIAPRFAWTRALSARELDAAVRRYLRAYAEVPPSGPGRVVDVAIESRTPSGRAAHVIIRTEQGTYRVRGNEARSVLRTAAGETLNSSYFSVTVESSAGRLSRAVFRGNGYGHGVGMCQWGAIGRARAGQDMHRILRTYYPGTTLGAIPPGYLIP